MSDRLTRARLSLSGVPKAPLAPIAPIETTIGANDTNGTGVREISADALADDFEERAAIAEFDGALPREIAEGLAYLQVMRPLPGFAPVRWLALIDGAGRFADRWAHRALALGWTPLELFGAHPAAPGARVDCRGLALMLAEADVAAMDASLAVIRHRHGGETKYRRWRENPGAMLVWEIKLGARDA